MDIQSLRMISLVREQRLLAALALGCLVGPMGAAAGVESATSGAASEVAFEELPERSGEEMIDAPPVVARPISPDPVQVFGWCEWIFVGGEKGRKLLGKLDTGAHLSSIHAENQEMFERDGQKWIRFEITWMDGDKKQKMGHEAPLVRKVQIKRPGLPLEQRNVVKLAYRIGARRIRGEFTLNDRDNMTAPILIGRADLKILGWVDPDRAFLADQKIFR